MAIISRKHCTAFSHNLDPSETLRPLESSRSALKNQTLKHAKSLPGSGCVTANPADSFYRTN
jgi:hypothetical protein